VVPLLQCAFVGSQTALFFSSLLAVLQHASVIDPYRLVHKLKELEKLVE